MRPAAQCGFRRAQMSKGVTASLSNSASKTPEGVRATRSRRAWMAPSIPRETRRWRLKRWWGEQTRVVAREKEKALGPCELRALRRDAPSSPREAWPKAHHRAPPDLAIRQRQLCSGARPSAQPYVACATRSESLPIASRRVTTATPVPGNWTSCMAG